MKKIKSIIIAIIATIAFSSCSDDDPARMAWDITATPTENFKATADPDFHPSVIIDASAKGGEVTLTCTNLNEIHFYQSVSKDAYTSEKCAFSATKTSSNTLKLTFNEMPTAETISEQIILWAKDRDTTISSTIQINRVP